MEQPHLVLPRLLPVQQQRPPQETIPQTRLERDRIKAMVQSYVAELKPVPPMPVDDLRMHADTVVEGAGLAEKYRDYVAVLLNNEAWRETLAGIPYERRLLMLPKCLRVEAKCPAPFDEFGLLCKHCGLCSIQDLQDEAERLGYAVLVAEGSALVTAIIQTGKIDAIVGVSCLSVLEKAFPFMEAAAVPGIAIPLLQDDCIDTNVDTDWVWDVLHLTSDDRTYRMDLDGIRREVDQWFTPAGLDALLGPAPTETERIGRAWLTLAGKRWRPFLTVCVYRALRQDPEAEFPEPLKKIAVAIECFHKASLIHDDIEDRDEQRYGVNALHTEHGVPVALNVGDYLLGEGYRLLATCGAPPETCAAMLRAAAEGHRTLTLGQGMELSWARAPKPLTSLEVLDIFRKKTAPAFQVALQLGSYFAAGGEDLEVVFDRYSEALGIAYQIRDDIDDLADDGSGADGSVRPSLPLAIALERSHSKEFLRELLRNAWTGSGSTDDRERILGAIRELGADTRCQSLLDAYKEEAIRSLADVENPSLKGLLRRIVGKIFNELEIKGWCSERQTGDAADRAARAQAAG
jgi:geranylgeranyl pyrophosphate synthase